MLFFSVNLSNETEHIECIEYVFCEWASMCVNVCFRCSLLRCSKGRVLFCCWQRSMKIPLFNYFHYTLWREESRNYCTRAKRWEENVKILLLVREKKLHFFAKSLNWEKNYKKFCSQRNRIQNPTRNGSGRATQPKKLQSTSLPLQTSFENVLLKWTVKHTEVFSGYKRNSFDTK